MTVAQLLSDMTSRLTPHYGATEAKAIARLTIEHLKGWTLADILSRGNAEVTDWLAQKIDSITDRLLLDEPIQYILGQAQFHGLKLKVSPATLIPRPETAELVDLIIERCGNRTDLRVLDIGTGSGAIILALGRSLRFPSLSAIDISADALSVAAANAAELHLDVKFSQADILHSDLNADYDIIVSNPPYIAESERPSLDANVALWEPGSALFVPDSDPLIFYRRIVALARRHLSPDGLLALEINQAYGQSTLKLVRDAGFSDAVLLRDSYGNDRFILSR